MLVASSFTLKMLAQLGTKCLPYRQLLAGKVQRTAGENWLLGQCALTLFRLGAECAQDMFCSPDQGLWPLFVCWLLQTV